MFGVGGSPVGSPVSNNLVGVGGSFTNRALSAACLASVMRGVGGSPAGEPVWGNLSVYSAGGDKNGVLRAASALLVRS